MNEVALKEMTQVPVKSRKAGGEGVVHTRTHVKFGSDGESSDEEYEDAARGRAGAMDVDGELQVRSRVRLGVQKLILNRKKSNSFSQ